MKTNILIKSLAALAVTGSMASCSKDYLDNEPITSIDTEVVTQSTKAAQMAIYGMCRGMWTQYQDVSDPRGMSGEATLNTAFNETLGPDYVSYFMMREMGINFYKWEDLSNPNSKDVTTAWMYCYNFINQANGIIDGIADAEGTEAERQFIEAQARTFRAHGYIKALQWFGPRWQDSNNGEKMAVVYREHQSTEAAPLASMNKVLNLIYSDLSKAEELYKASGMQRSNSFEPDIYVAYGLHARAALLKNDWATAEKMAHNARQGQPVMSNDEYMMGFADECTGYMWTNQDNDVYYSSFASWYACNGAYPCNWSRGTAINLDLYSQLDPNDVRRNLYFTPDKVAQVAAIPGYESVASLKTADFFNEKNIAVGSLDCLVGQDDAGNDLPMTTLSKGFVEFAAANNPIASYMVRLPYCPDMTPDPTSMMLGAQVKFWGLGYYGDSKYPYMRVAEMILTEAEAAYMAGHVAVAKACLEELNSVRIPGYTCKTSGSALLDEIRLTRRIELWGEGFNFIDFKRWNLPYEQRAWVAGDVNSGNCPATYAMKHAVSDANGWRLTIPQSESDFNPLLDRTQLK